MTGVVDEVRRKAPVYFDRHSLRLAQGHRLCAALGDALDLRIEAGAPCAPVDRYLADLLGPAPAPAAADPAAVRAIAAADLAARRRARERARGLPRTLCLRVAHSPSGTVPYVARGASGPLLIILNAIGQGLEPWYPLMERLQRRRRVVAWELDAARHDGEPPTVDDYVDALGAIVDCEGADRCDLLGWCASAKIAVAFGLRRPDAVRSVVVLNGSFKHPGRSPSLDSTYERDLETVCATLCRRPERAAALRGLLAASAGWAAQEPDTAEVLGFTDPDLRDAVSRPFADDARLVAYARAHLEYWSRDILVEGPKLTVPVVLVAGEYDRIVTPAGVRDAARSFPTGRFVLLPGASHHRMYDRPDLVAALLDEVAAR